MDDLELPCWPLLLSNEKSQQQPPISTLPPFTKPRLPCGAKGGGVEGYQYWRKSESTGVCQSSQAFDLRFLSPIYRGSYFIFLQNIGCLGQI